MLKKALSTAIAFLLVFSLCAGIIFLFMPEAFYSRFYFGSRIIGNISVNIDGREVPVSDCGLRCLLNVSEEQEIGISGNKLKVKADGVGQYGFTAENSGTELKFYIDKLSVNDCISFDMDFDIDTKQRVIHYSGSYKNFSDGLLKAGNVPVSGDYPLDYEHHSIGIYVNKIQ